MRAQLRPLVAAAKAALTLCLVLLSVLVSSVVSVQREDARPPVVRTRQGAVRGRQQTSSSGRPFLAFYNLPYAKPPVGPLRFRDPQPAEEWVHIRDATSPGASCIQNDDTFLHAGVSGSEDCLYLNVFTPQLSETKLLPVMFWIHGGGFFVGGSTAYGPDFLLNHDIVLVTINYRLGPFGFLSTEDDAAPGNFGLKDQVAALRWVHENIAAFGGDPHKVTIFGESAGAASVHFLTVSPLAKGLFQRAIMQSGSALGPWALARKGIVVQNTRKLASALDCPVDGTTSMVDCLRNVDDYLLLDSNKYGKKWGPFPIVAMYPVVEDDKEGAFLPKHPLHLKPADVDWMIGAVEDEGLFLTADMYGNRTLMKYVEENLSKILPIMLLYDMTPNANVITEELRNFYFPSERVSFREMTDLFSDAMVMAQTDETVRLYKNTASAFYYVLTYRGKYRIADIIPNSDDFGAVHTDDLMYLFPKNPFYPGNYELPDEDMKFAHTMTKLWTNFAKTGNPTPDDEPLHWQKVTSDDEPEYLDLGTELKMRKGVAKKRMEFWRTLPFRQEHSHDSFKEEL